MKKFLKIFFSIILLCIILGIIFYMIDSTRANNGEEPIFTFHHKIIDGIDYSAKVDAGLGYKIIRYDVYGENIIKTGTIFMEEDLIYKDKPYVEDFNISGESGESGEKIVKLTTFGDNYKDIIVLEGFESEVNVKDINSKIGYTMSYYYELFEYSGFETHDVYLWHLSSGEDKAVMNVYDISIEEEYKAALDKINDDDLYEEVSGESTNIIKNLYYKTFEEDDIMKVNYIYLVELNDLRLMIELSYRQEAEEGLGIYMHRMTKSIRKQSLNRD